MRKINDCFECGEIRLAAPHFSHTPLRPPAQRYSAQSLLLAAIGRQVRSHRKRHGMTVTELAATAAISPGMLSKIENGVISASLYTLKAIASALGIPLTRLFRPLERADDAVLVKAGHGLNIERRGARTCHQYHPLSYMRSGADGIVVEPYLITLTAPMDHFPMFQHDGQGFVYILEGEVVYRHGANLYQMTLGDSLFFNADAPHGPHQLTSLPILYLSVLSYRLTNGAA